jgi:hypothetical protein
VSARDAAPGAVAALGRLAAERDRCGPEPIAAILPRVTHGILLRRLRTAATVRHLDDALERKGLP